jgi:hypothetical protein
VLVLFDFIKEKAERSSNSIRRIKDFPHQNLLDGIARIRQKVAKNATQDESKKSFQDGQNSSDKKEEHKSINNRNGESKDFKCNQIIMTFFIFLVMVTFKPLFTPNPNQ